LGCSTALPLPLSSLGLGFAGEAGAGDASEEIGVDRSGRSSVLVFNSRFTGLELLVGRRVLELVSGRVEGPATPIAADCLVLRVEGFVGESIPVPAGRDLVMVVKRPREGENRIDGV
jgi:hypothetical protein